MDFSKSNMIEMVRYNDQTKPIVDGLTTEWARPRSDILGYVKEVLEEHEDLNVTFATNLPLASLGKYIYRRDGRYVCIILDKHLSRSRIAPIVLHEAIELAIRNRSGELDNHEYLEGGYMKDPREIVYDSAATKLVHCSPVPRKTWAERNGHDDESDLLSPKLTFDQQMITQELIELAQERQDVDRISHVQIEETIYFGKDKFTDGILIRNTGTKQQMLPGQEGLLELLVNSSEMSSLMEIAVFLASFAVFRSCPFNLRRSMPISNSISCKVYTSSTIGNCSMGQEEHMDSVKFVLRVLENGKGILRPDFSKISKFMVYNPGSESFNRFTWCLRPEEPGRRKNILMKFRMLNNDRSDPIFSVLEDYKAFMS